ncbi:putative vomeronasal receptor-like protein 4 [Loxodonta africana]|uniref:putative vomeronasal receptor-like protein 4 n=1 Tax=Loxodonta africana TaxID=9785 RepID=UPI0030D0DA1D
MIVTTVIMVSLDILDILGSHNVQVDLTCKAMPYLKTVMRDLSICTICMLSVLQAITICPSNSWLAKFKHQPFHYILCLFLLFFVLNLPLSGIIIIYTSAVPNGTKENILVFTEHCALWPMRYFLFLWTLSWHLLWINDPVSICFRILMVNGYSSIKKKLVLLY